MKLFLIFIASIGLQACGGGGGGGGASYIAPSLNSTTWATDHITRTRSYSDGSTIVDTVNPTTSTPILTSENYASNWTTGGNVSYPSVSPKNYVYGDGYISAIETGSVSKPFSQTTLSPLSISDPNSYVTSSTATFNLNWGTPDTNGPGYANIYPSASNTLGSALSYVGRAVAGQTTAGPTLLAPSADVLAA